VYGAKVVSTTATSAILEWSTTRQQGANVTCANLTFSEQGEGLTHTIELTGLEFDTSYNCSIVIDGVTPTNLSFNTSAEVDSIPPEILNLMVEVIEGGSLKVTWYTSEDATESIEVEGQTFVGDNVALRKNHEMTVVPYPELVALQTYTLTINISDASGNTNSSSVDFFIEEEDAASPLPDEEIPDDGNNPNESNNESTDTTSIGNLFGNSVVQLGLLLVVILVITALIRTRKYQD
jgi:hypothetical protein